MVKKLGNGVIGTTYLVTKNQREFVCKVQKIPESDITPNLSKRVWREIEFSKFTKKYPQHFMSLKSWTILDDCEHNQPSPPNWIRKSVRKDLIKINKSRYCSQMLYTPVLDDTLDNFYKSVNKLKTTPKSLISSFCQIIYAIHLLISNKYIHTDVHSTNIMYKKTSNKTIQLGQVTIPTYGMQWYIIDYGEILSTHFGDQLKNWHSDYAFFLFNSVKMPIWEIVEVEKIKVTPYDELIKRIKKSTEFKAIKPLVPKINEPLPKHNCLAALFLLHFPIKFHEFMNIDTVKYRKYIVDYEEDYKNMYILAIKHIKEPMKAIEAISKYF